MTFVERVLIYGLNKPSTLQLAASVEVIPLYLKDRYVYTDEMMALLPDTASTKILSWVN